MKLSHWILLFTIAILFALFGLAALVVTRAIDWPNPYGLIFLCLAVLAIVGQIIERKGGKRG